MYIKKLLEGEKKKALRAERQIVSLLHYRVNFELNELLLSYVNNDVEIYGNSGKIKIIGNNVEMHSYSESAIEYEISSFFSLLRSKIENNLNETKNKLEQCNWDVRRYLQKEDILLADFWAYYEQFKDRESLELDFEFLESNKWGYSVIIIDDDRLKLISQEKASIKKNKKEMFESRLPFLYEQIIRNPDATTENFVKALEWIDKQIDKEERSAIVKGKLKKLEQVLDYLMSPDFTEIHKIHKIKLTDIILKTKRWEEKLIKSKRVREKTNDVQAVLVSKDWSFVKLSTRNALKYESSYMGHCIGNGGYDFELELGEEIFYSLRDRENKPVATIEFSKKRDMIYQIKGFKNGAISLEWQEPLQYIVSNFFKINESRFCNDFENIGLQSLSIIKGGLGLLIKKTELNLGKIFPLKNPQGFKIADYKAYIDEVLSTLKKNNYYDTIITDRMIEEESFWNQDFKEYKGRYLSKEQVVFYEKVFAIEDKYKKFINNNRINFDVLEHIKNGKITSLFSDFDNYVYLFVSNIELHENFKKENKPKSRKTKIYFDFLNDLFKVLKDSYIILKQDKAHSDISIYLRLREQDTFNYKDYKETILTKELRNHIDNVNNSSEINKFLREFKASYTVTAELNENEITIYTLLSKSFDLFKSNCATVLNMLYEYYPEDKKRVDVKPETKYVILVSMIDKLLNNIDLEIDMKNNSYNWKAIKEEVIKVQAFDLRMEIVDILDSHFMYWGSNQVGIKTKSS